MDMGSRGDEDLKEQIMSRQSWLNVSLMQPTLGGTPHALAWRAGRGGLWSWLPDEDKVGVRTLPSIGMVDSVARWVGDEPLAAQPG